MSHFTLHCKSLSLILSVSLLSPSLCCLSHFHSVSLYLSRSVSFQISLSVSKSVSLSVHFFFFLSFVLSSISLSFSVVFWFYFCLSLDPFLAFLSLFSAVFLFSMFLSVSASPPPLYYCTASNHQMDLAVEESWVWQGLVYVSVTTSP